MSLIVNLYVVGSMFVSIGIIIGFVNTLDHFGSILVYRHASPGVGAPGAATIRTSAGSPPASTAFIAATSGG